MATSQQNINQWNAEPNRNGQSLNTKNMFGSVAPNNISSVIALDGPEE